jgi:plasmid stability protein
VEDAKLATLNIKGFPDALYRKLQKRAREQHRSVAQEVTHLLTEVLEPRQLSIMGLEGLGKELWRGIDAAKYVAAERDSWD